MSTIMADVFTLFVDNLFLVGLFTAVLLLYLSRMYGFYIIKIEDGTEIQQNTTECLDKTCVRCNNYRAVVALARTRLKLKTVVNSDISRNIQTALLPQYEMTIDARQRPNILLYERLASRAVWNPADFEDVAIVESAFPVILKEFQNLLAQPDLPGWKQNRTPVGSWDVFPLVNQGEIVHDNAEICPETMATLNSLSSALAKNVFGNVMFSVVKPSTLITEHYGPTNIRLRCHLGLVTTPYCCLRVDEDELIWNTGKCIIFDDSYLHSVSHDGVVLDDAERTSNHIGDNDGTCVTRDSGVHESSSNLDSSSSRVRSSLDECLISVHQGGGARSEEKADGARSEKGVVPPVQGRLEGAGIDRAVLILDLWHPGLSQEERDIIDCVFSPTPD